MPRVGLRVMARYRIKEDASTVSIEVADVDGREQQLLQAFGECQAGRCTCPTDEYEKLAAMHVDRVEDAIRLRLDSKPGEKFDVAEIAACLDYTTAKIAETDPRK